MLGARSIRRSEDILVSVDSVVFVVATYAPFWPLSVRHELVP